MAHVSPTYDAFPKEYKQGNQSFEVMKMIVCINTAEDQSWNLKI